MTHPTETVPARDYKKAGLDKERTMARLVAALALIGLASAGAEVAGAQAPYSFQPGLYAAGSAGVLELDDDTGGAVTGSLLLAQHPALVFLNTVDLAVEAGESGVTYGASADLGLLVPRPFTPLFVGGGVRTGQGTRGYALAGLLFQRGPRTLLFVRFIAGGSVVGASAGAAFKL